MSVANLRHVNYPPHACELKNHVTLCHESQNSIFSPLTKGKNQSFEGDLVGAKVQH